MPKYNVPGVCEYCDSPYVKTAKHQKFCKPLCRARAYWQKTTTPDAVKELSERVKVLEDRVDKFTREGNT